MSTYNYILNVKYGSDPIQFANVYFPTTGITPKGVILHIHGGGWASADGAGAVAGTYSNLYYPSSTGPSTVDVAEMATAGYAVVDVNYRDRTLGNGGGIESPGNLPGDVLDVTTVLSYCLDATAAANAYPTGVSGISWADVNSYISANKGLTVCGSSAGGHLTLYCVCYYGTMSGHWPKAAINNSGPPNLNYFDTTHNYIDPFIRSIIIDQYVHTGLESDLQLASPLYQYGAADGAVPGLPKGPWFDAVNASPCKFFFILNENDTLVPIYNTYPIVAAFKTWNPNNTAFIHLREGAPLGDWDGSNPVTNKGTLTSTSQLPSTGNTLGDMYLLPDGFWVYNNGTYPGAVGGPASVNGFTSWFTHWTISSSEYQTTVEIANNVFGNLTLSPGSPALDNDVSNKLPAGTQGTFYSQQFTAGGGNAPYNYWVVYGNIPGGTNIDSSTGILSGIPAQAGIYTFSVRVTDADGAVVRQNYQITIASSVSIPSKFQALTSGQDSIFRAVRYPRNHWHIQYWYGIGPSIFNAYYSDSTNLEPDSSPKHLSVADEIHTGPGQPSGQNLQALCDLARSSNISPGVVISPAAEQGYNGITPVPTLVILADAIRADWVVLDPYLYTVSLAYYNNGDTTLNQTNITNTINGLISWTQGWIDRLKPYNIPVGLITQGIRQVSMPQTYVDQYLTRQYQTFNSSNIFTRVGFAYESMRGIETYLFVPVDLTSYISQYPFVNSDASLSNLTVSAGTLTASSGGGGFSSNLTSYTDSVDNSVSSISVTPTVNNAGATVTVNGTLVTSGSPSTAIGLNVGNNSVTIVVTAQDGVTTQTYTINVVRAPASIISSKNYTINVSRAAQILSNDALLSNLTASSGSISFNSQTTYYNIQLSNNITTISLTPTTEQANATVTINGTTVASGSPSSSINLNVGSNIVTIVVTAQDGVTTKTYTVNVVRSSQLLSTDALLSNLTISNGSLTFSPQTVSYMVSVADGVTSVTVTPTADQSNATITVNGNGVTSGSPSNSINLNTGPNTITIVVTAQDGLTNKSYTIIVTRAQSISTDSSLSYLGASAGALLPSFGPTILTYTDSVPNSTSSITFTAISNNNNATIKINGTSVTSGTASSPINLNVGTNVVNIVVTSQNNVNSTIYQVTVTRAALLSTDATLSNLTISNGTLTPTFNGSMVLYADTVDNSVGSVTVTATTNESHAQLTINGVVVRSGTASSLINLNVGQNKITIVVTAQDGITIKTYTINVTRSQPLPSSDASLSSLTISNGSLSFNSQTTSYTVSVANSVSSVTVTPTHNQVNARIIVNGVGVNSGTASEVINLSVGSNTITVSVTAQDNTTIKIYKIIVNRAAPSASSDATLRSLLVTGGSLNPTFNSATTHYTESVSYNTGIITVLPVINESHATVLVNGTFVNSGTLSGPISLTVGSNTITVFVKAQDGTTTITYTVIVTRLPLVLSNNALLSNLLISSGTLNPIFNSSIVGYTNVVDNTVSSITITPVTSDSHAKLTVNGFPISSGSSSNSISLSTGINTIIIVVTAQNGTTQKTYTLTVERSPAYVTKSKPIWLTPTGFLFTATVGVYTSTVVIAGGAGVTYSLMGGKFPGGLTFSSNGFITGTPTPVTTSTLDTFVVRAKNIQGSADNYFTISIPGPTRPLSWSLASVSPDVELIPSVFLSIGPSGEPWLLNHQYVNYQLLAISDPYATVKYYTTSTLPPGLTLSTDGLISGYVNDTLNGDAKNYPVTLVATNGTYQISQDVVLTVTDPYILLSLHINYVPPIQFIYKQDIYVRTLTRDIVDLSGYDPYPGTGSVTYALTSGSLPPELSFDGTKGYVSGLVDYQPVYTRTYPLTIQATKTATIGTTSSQVSFNLIIEGNIYDNITWITSSTLATLATGQVSSIQLQSTSTIASSNIKYQLVSGSLPSGLTLIPDGSIVGQADYGTEGTYTVTIEAVDVYNSAPNQRDFTLTIVEKEFTKIYLRPFLPKDRREVYYNFISDNTIFPQSLLYRPYDPNFGVQHDIRMYLEFGIQRLNIADYVVALRENFYRKRIYFGDLKTAVARDSVGNIIYEVVYVDAKDRLINNAGVSSELVIYINGQVYYPNSMTNMREALESITVPNGSGDYTNIAVDSYNTPVYMETTQAGSYQLPGYMRVIPICYTLPGQSTKIVDKIQATGFDFKQFDFDVDRIIIENALDQGTAKYLVFGRNNLFEQIDSDSVIYESTGPTLDTQGVPGAPDPDPLIRD